MLFIIFDLDGTLSNDNHRQHLLKREPPDYAAYFDRCADDTPITPAITVYRLFVEAGHRVEIWTGRVERTRSQTLEWLNRHVGRIETPDGDVHVPVLRMRGDDDIRRARILKGEWLSECIRRGTRPDLVLDDRRSMVGWWRGQDIDCWAVADHEY